MRYRRSWSPRCQKRNWSTADCLHCQTLWKITDDYCLMFPVPYRGFWTWERYEQRGDSFIYPGNSEINEELRIPFIRVKKELFWVLTKRKIRRGYVDERRPEEPRKIVR